jgi:ABC-type phosphate transport system substrate-binding protein
VRRRYRWSTLLPALVALVAAPLLALPRTTHAAGFAPSAAQIPEWSGSNFPYRESSAPGMQIPQPAGPNVVPPSNPWTFSVVSGGLKPGDYVTFTFTSKGKIGDPLHSVGFQDGSDFAGITMGSSPLPASFPERATGCNSNGTSAGVIQPLSEVGDLYAQSVTVEIPRVFPAGTVVNYCFGGYTITFPYAVDPGYEIRYTEPGGSTTVPYSVIDFNKVAPASSYMQLFDGGTEVTDTGFGGTAPLQLSPPHGAVHSYKLVLTGATKPNSSANAGAGSTGAGEYTVSIIAPATTSDTNTVVGTSAAQAGCTPGGVGNQGTFCIVPSGTGSTWGTATGVLTVVGTETELIEVTAVDQDNNEPQSSMWFTVAPAGAGPPHASPLPSPPGVGQHDYDLECQARSAGLAANQGLGSQEVFDANNEAIQPVVRNECPALATKLAYFGLNDNGAISEVFGNPATRFAFAGLDRTLTANEVDQYGVPVAANGTNAINSRGLLQFPIFLEPLAVSYNLDDPSCGGKDTVLQLSSHTLSLIFSGVITQWNQVPLFERTSTADGVLNNCKLPILVAHDLGIASSLFKTYLANRNPQWQPFTQPQLAASWPTIAPVACTANGSAAMALCILGQPGMIGYGYYRNIHAAGLPLASVDNAARTFFQGDAQEGCTIAATNPQVPTNPATFWPSPFVVDDPRGPTDENGQPVTSGQAPYPICGFDFATSKQDPCVLPSQAGPIIGFLAWLGAVNTVEAQKSLRAAGYASLPPALINGNIGEMPDPSQLFISSPTQLNCAP